jgi:hypothetical protein
VQNPFRTEAEAFRFTVATLAFFAVIVIAVVVGGFVPGIIVFGLLALVAALWLFRGPAAEPPVQTSPTAQADREPGERRILVIANETVGGGPLQRCIRQKTEGARAHVLVVSPALNSPLRHWVSDEDSARAAAQERIDRSLAQLADAGIDGRGEIGDADPLQAIEDALRTFGPDEVIISTHPEGRSHWLERGVVEAARARFAVPITHVVVDLEAEQQEEVR